MAVLFNTARSGFHCWNVEAALNPSSTSHFLTVKQAAELEGVSPQQICILINRGIYLVEEIVGRGGKRGNVQYLIDPLSFSSYRLRRILLFKEAVERLNRAGRDEVKKIVNEIYTEIGLSRSALYRLRKEYKETGSMAAFKRRGTRKMLNDNI